MKTLFELCLLRIQIYNDYTMDYLTKAKIDAIPSDLYNNIRNCVLDERKQVELFGDYHYECYHKLSGTPYKRLCEYSSDGSKRHGKEQLWLNNVLIEEKLWRNGVLDGEHRKWWRSNGALQMLAYYRNDELLSINHYWEDGCRVF